MRRGARAHLLSHPMVYEPRREGTDDNSESCRFGVPVARAHRLSPPAGHWWTHWESALRACWRATRKVHAAPGGARAARSSAAAALDKRQESIYSPCARGAERCVSIIVEFRLYLSCKPSLVTDWCRPPRVPRRPPACRSLPAVPLGTRSIRRGSAYNSASILNA